MAIKSLNEEFIMVELGRNENVFFKNEFGYVFGCHDAKSSICIRLYSLTVMCLGKVQHHKTSSKRELRLMMRIDRALGRLAVGRFCWMALRDRRSR